MGLIKSVTLSQFLTLGEMLENNEPKHVWDSQLPLHIVLHKQLFPVYDAFWFGQMSGCMQHMENGSVFVI